MHQLLNLQDLGSAQTRLDFRHHVRRHAARDFPFFITTRVIHSDVEQKPIQLRFGEGVRSFLLQRILRGQYNKWSGNQVHLAAHTDVPLLHRFEHRGLCLGRRPIDFIGQHEIGKNRAREEPVSSFPSVWILLNHLGARHVAGHQVGRELDALECQIEAHANELTSNVLASPGTPSNNAWPHANIVTSTCSITSSWPTITLANCSRICRYI